MRRLENIFLAFLFCSCINAMGCSDAESTKETEVPSHAQETWELPEGMTVIPIALHVSPTGSHVSFLARRAKSNRSRGRTILDTRSGKVSRVSSFCEAVGITMIDPRRIEFSRNGKDLLVHAAVPCIAKIDLTTGRTTKVMDIPFPRFRLGWWFGDNVAVSTVESGPDSKTYPVAIVSPEGTAIRTLPVYGEIAAADRNGRFLVVLADPNHLTQPMACKSLTAHVLVVSAEGKTLRDLGLWQCLTSAANWKICISPSGAYVAFEFPGSPKEVEEAKTTTRIVSMLDGSERRVLGGRPIVVTDKGELLTWEGRTTGSNDKDAPPLKTSWVFKLSSVGGKEELLFGGDPKVVAATIANGRLYCLSQLANGKPGISWVKFR